MARVSAWICCKRYLHFESCINFNSIKSAKNMVRLHNILPLMPVSNRTVPLQDKLLSSSYQPDLRIPRGPVVFFQNKWLLEVAVKMLGMVHLSLFSQASCFLVILEYQGLFVYIVPAFYITNFKRPYRILFFH